MKRNILIILCMLLAYNMHAQLSHDNHANSTRNFAYCNYMIDSLVTFYSVDESKKITLYSQFENTYLSVKEKKKIITRIKQLFEQREYTNLFVLGHALLYDMWTMSPIEDSPEIKQLLTELYLEFYYYPGNHSEVIVNSNAINAKDNYTKKAKRRLVEILEGKKTKEEYEIYLKWTRSKENTYYTKMWTEIAARNMEQRSVKNDTVLQLIRDSLMNNEINESAKKEFESLQIDNELIRMTGLLDMKECIPVLKQKLSHCIESDCLYGQENAYRYALARLGDEEQRRYVLDILMGIELFDRRDFAYFRDDEMIWKYIEVNYFSNIVINRISANLLTMNNVYPYIKNLPEELAFPYKTNDMNEDYKWAKLLYEWLMSHKATVEFDYDGEKSWFWG